MSDASPNGRPADRIVGIGASAGGLDALITLVRALPADLDAAVCVVLHIPASGPSLLAQILGRHARMDVRTAEHGMPLLGRTVYVAPPDRHLVVQRAHVELSQGPKENGVRPAVDVTLRSLADVHGSRAIAVVLSGALDDGASGAALVAAAGGVVVIQDPDDAIVPSMPRNAMLAAPQHVTATAEEMGRLLGRLVQETEPRREDRFVTGQPEDLAERSRIRPDGSPTAFSCPECNGPLWELREGKLTRFRCRVGHMYSHQALLADNGTSTEAALWTALEALEARAEMLRRVAARVGAGSPGAAARLEDGARDALRRAELVRTALLHDARGTDAFAAFADPPAATGTEG